MIPCGHLMDDYPVFQRFSLWSIKTQNMSYALTNLYVFSFEKILHQSKLLLDISENFWTFRSIEKIGIYHIFELLRLSQFSATFNIKEGLKRVKYLF